jgi:5'-nucleotidase
MRLRFLTALALLGTFAGGCVRTPATLGARPDVGAVRLLLVNDVYVVDTLRDGSGGLARVAALRQRVEHDSIGGRVLFLLAGDVLSPSLLSKWYAGRQMVDAFNAAKLDYATFGNHEFELDRDTLIARIDASRFRWLSTNCMQSDGSSFPGVPPWDTTTVGGVRVGIFALTLRGDYRRYVKCTNPDSAAHLAILALRAAGADLVVGLTHQTLSADSALLVREPGLDLILGGHEHEWHLVRIGGRLVAKADADARSTQLVTVRRESILEPWREEARRFDIGRPLPFDPAVTATANRWRDSLLQRLGPERTIGMAVERIDGRDAVSRRGESPLGDLVTDAMRSGTGADVAIINSGTLRLDDWLGPGPITNYQLESIFLFADETRVVTFPLTGARLRELLEHSVSDAGFGHGAFLQTSGLRFRYDLARPEGSRVVGDVLREGSGAPLVPGDTLRVAFDVYPACTGGDGYVVPEAAPSCEGRATAPRAVDLLQRYLAGPLAGRIAPPPPGRMERIGGSTGAASGVGR